MIGKALENETFDYIIVSDNLGKVFIDNSYYLGRTRDKIKDNSIDTMIIILLLPTHNLS